MSSDMHGLERQRNNIGAPRRGRKIAVGGRGKVVVMMYDLCEMRIAEVVRRVSEEWL